MQFEKAKGQRLHSRFFGVSVEQSDKCWWCNNRWMTIEEANATKKEFSNFAKVRTLRAFRRHLRKYGTKGIKYTLTSNYVGFNVTAFGKNLQ